MNRSTGWSKIAVARKEAPLEGPELGILDDDYDGPKKGSGVQLPEWIWDRLDEMAKKRGKSRNWVMARLLRYAIEAYDRSEQYDVEKTKKKQE